jgi:hypothetical protein
MRRHISRHSMSCHTFPKPVILKLGCRVNTHLLSSELAMPGRALSQTKTAREHNDVEKWMGKAVQDEIAADDQ